MQRRQGCTEEGVPNIYDFGVPDIGNKNLIMALHEHRPSLDTRCSTRTAKIIKKYLQCAWILTVSGTRGVGRLSRGPSSTPPRLH